MFEQTLIESNHTIQSNRGKSTIVSFILQCIIIGLVILIPPFVHSGIAGQGVDYSVSGAAASATAARGFRSGQACGG